MNKFNHLKMETVFLKITTAILIILFIYTGLSKLLEHHLFEYQLQKSLILHSISPILSWTLPILEIIVALLLASERFRKIGLYSSLILFAIFIIYLSIMLSFFKKLPCSCGGFISTMSWKQHLLFNIFLSVLSLTSIRLQKLVQPIRIIIKRTELQNI